MSAVFDLWKYDFLCAEASGPGRTHPEIPFLRKGFNLTPRWCNYGAGNGSAALPTHNWEVVVKVHGGAPMLLPIGFKTAATKAVVPERLNQAVGDSRILNTPKSIEQARLRGCRQRQPSNKRTVLELTGTDEFHAEHSAKTACLTPSCVYAPGRMADPAANFNASTGYGSRLVRITRTPTEARKTCAGNGAGSHQFNGRKYAGRPVHGLPNGTSTGNGCNAHQFYGGSTQTGPDQPRRGEAFRKRMATTSLSPL